ncbi:hypothetical protein DYB37_008371 [Aphanomyces astaci]|uniref:Uncharacterized protein n=1 Tax=Aphanomyces astaci TaxID=112090 RepID=A0A3R7AML3_APHAT|nr:hypothetical protein DYB35_006558 [Aphanomyces astaci]RHZ21920.1 hypothetical protein DYB37_008371 [Aphanomyces astaci]
MWVSKTLFVPRFNKYSLRIGYALICLIRCRHGAGHFQLSPVHGTMSDTTWNIMQDLQFLIAPDDELQDEFALVCDLLDSDPCTDELRKPSAPPKRRRKRRNRVDNYKIEITLLRAQVETLTSELEVMKAKYPMIYIPAWKMAARRLRVEAMRCQVENEALRAAVDERGSFLDNMKRLLHKKPRWSLS